MGLDTSAGAQPAKIHAGAAVIDITPQKLPVSMTGSFQDRQATAVHDRLNARCVVLSDGHIKAAIVVCDSCLISRQIFDAAKKIASEKTGIPTNHMLMSATHTHTAATTLALAQCNPDADYVRFLTGQIAESVIAAHNRLRPARVGWAVGKEPNEVSNRRWFVKPDAIRPNPFGRVDDQVRMNPPRGSDVLIKSAGPIDPDVSILSVQDANGRPLALLANYSLHYVGGIPANQLSADYFGEFARQIATRLKAEESFVGIMSNGTSGDVNNYNFQKPRPRAAPFERVRAVARRISAVAHDAYKTIEHTDKIALTMIERTIDLGVRRPKAVEVKRAKQLLANAANPKRLNTDELYAQETLRLAEYPAAVNIKLQVLRIGDLGIVAIPCEVFAQIGLDIKRRSPLKHTFTIGLANGYNGYLPTPRQHTLGGYETWRSGWSYLEEDASTKITKSLLEMIGDTDR
ncbi:MAG: neutral/alkaline non-lysosomal ceramidase N-terminal domain-containing protein [Planctomycetes bacterium]|nr:neutral/alkaline non-lysosomal ceramidase N-terminal domain-containing protein [Planctomycetota bacterium]